MQSYSDNLWSTLGQRSDFDLPPPYSSLFPATTPPHVFAGPVMDSVNFAPFQDLIDRRNWCLTNLQLSAKQAEALRQENVNLQMANCELNKQLSQLQLASGSVNSSVNGSVSNVRDYVSEGSVNRFGRVRIGEMRGNVVREKRVARGVENVDPVVKDQRVKLPKSISVRSNGYLRTVIGGGGDGGGGGAARARAGDRVKLGSDMQKVYVRGKKEEQPVELKVYNQGMTKTELCNKWQQTGACPYGDHCQFAHGIEELRPVIRHPRYKTEVCRMVLAGDPCPYGHRCHFRHALTEEEKLMS
ncbi:zinc finger CCCH domain-containing protein 15-like [Bidens hawaiensis]|uniref:zinc finger CCCH domain-containing protein 15-like n=1 Tax=Bidens hawaiensis TaxID=980011 RepID=UPI00404922D3